MVYPQVIGQKRVKEVLTKFFVSKNIPHALLLLGKDGSQSKEMGYCFSKTLLCDHPESQYCGKCVSCHLFDSVSHPDFFCLKPVGKLRQVKKEDVDELLKFISLKSYRGGYKVIFIEQADRLSQTCANALLKSLEEPPDYTVFILISSKESDLLPTIVSRCQILEFLPLKPEELRSWLEENREKFSVSIDVLESISEGEVGNLQGEKLENSLKNREIMFAMISDWTNRGKIAVIDGIETILGYLDDEKKRLEKEVVASLKNLPDTTAAFVKKQESILMADMEGVLKKKLDDLLQILSDFWRDVFLLKNNIPPQSIKNKDQMAVLQKTANYSIDVEQNMMCLDQMRRRLQGTVNQKLALENLLLTVFP